MVLQIAFHTVFSHQAGGLVCFEDSSNIPDLSSKSDCNSSAEVPSFILRTALSAMPFVSDRCGAHVQGFHDNSSQDLPDVTDLSAKMTFGFSHGSRNFL